MLAVHGTMDSPVGPPTGMETLCGKSCVECISDD
jgi:hypothetical protein